MGDWLNDIPDVWLLVGWVGLMLIAVGILLIVLVWATNPDRYVGTRRSTRPAGAEPYAASHTVFPRGVVSYQAGLRVGGWVPAGNGRHHAQEEGPTRDLRWKPTRRETL